MVGRNAANLLPSGKTPSSWRNRGSASLARHNAAKRRAAGR
jgi:hypothetical protein